MSKIVELDTLTINKIAAGEVIERPASVVKELVENSIDAKSSKIQINIEDGGKKLIEIIDDGIGMEYADALLAIKRHTTSKIRTADDLFSIHSLGFRGEALASIVSISLTELTTRTKDDELATHLVVDGGKVTVDEKTSSHIGTKLSVKNLFYNVPVRRNFLKSSSTEITYVTEIITKLALANPHIFFELKHNGKTLLSPPKGELLTNIASIFGNNIAKACLPVNISDEGYFLSGFITKPEFSRKTRDYLYLYVNNRCITDKLLTDAIMKGYGTSIPDGKYPISFLFLSLPADEVDVNVHPTKKEVRFSKESKLFTLFETAVSSALENAGIKVFERVSHPKAPSLSLPNNYSQKSKTLPQTTVKSPSPSITHKYRYKSSSVSDLSSYIENFEPSVKKPELELSKEDEIHNITVLGVLGLTYIVAKIDETLLICDQHAAHEKINYIAFKKQLEKKRITTQQLLVPLSVSLKPSDIAQIESIKDKLLEMGFEVEPFGGNEVLLRCIPTTLGKVISPNFAKDVIDLLLSNVEDIRNTIKLEDMGFIKDMIALMSCRRSIKAGDKITTVEAEKIIKDLLKLEDPYTCPHGRSTMVLLNEKYLDELFGRDYR